MRDDNSTAPRGPGSDFNRTVGLSSLGRTVIRCQAVRGARRCDTRLAVVEGDAEPVGTVEDLRFVHDGHHGAWCHRCRRVTVYVVKEVA